MNSYSLPESPQWTEVPRADQPEGTVQPFARLGLNNADGDIIGIVDLIAFPAEGEESESLPTLITAPDEAPGPHVWDTVLLPGGTTAYRSLGPTLEPLNEQSTPIEFVCYHALRRGSIDVVAATWLGPDPGILTEVITPLETMLDSLQIES